MDVEDWYHDALEPSAGREERLDRNLNLLLELFAEHDVRATCFFLGDIATRHPHLVRRAVAAGHEIGSHGYQHVPVRSLLRREFRDDVSRSVEVLEQAAGVKVRGYRAPYFSIKAGVRWPIDELWRLGLSYDSSILPIDRPPGLVLVCPRGPFQHHNGLWEIPVALLRMFLFWHLPLASGAGLRIFPSRLVLRWLRCFEREVGAGVFYLHPWEIDPHSPTRRTVSRCLLRMGRRRLPRRLAALFRKVEFAPIWEVFGKDVGALDVSTTSPAS